MAFDSIAQNEESGDDTAAGEDSRESAQQGPAAAGRLVPEEARHLHRECCGHGTVPLPRRD